MAIKLKTFDQGLGDGTEKFVKGFIDGSISITDFYTVMALKGRAFAVNIGLLTTPITFGATTTFDITKPAAFMIVPSNTTIIPVHIAVYMEVYGTDVQFEIGARMGTGGSRTSGGTAVTPVNMRSDAPLASNCSAYAGNSTPVFVGATTNLNDFWRDGLQFAITKTASSATAAAADPYKFVWSLRDGVLPPIGVGAAQLAVHQGTNAGQGFILINYIEFPSSWLP